MGSKNIELPSSSKTPSRLLKRQFVRLLALVQPKQLAGHNHSLLHFVFRAAVPNPFHRRQNLGIGNLPYSAQDIAIQKLVEADKRPRQLTGTASPMELFSCGAKWQVGPGWRFGASGAGFLRLALAENENRLRRALRQIGRCRERA
jgi:hypothetical protein